MEVISPHLPPPHELFFRPLCVPPASCDEALRHQPTEALRQEAFQHEFTLYLLALRSAGRPAAASVALAVSPCTFMPWRRVFSSAS